MKNIVELRSIVSVADDVKLKLFARLQEGVLDLGLENGYLLSGKGMKLGLDFGVVNNGNLQSVVLQDFNLPKIQFLRHHSNLGPIRIGTNIQQTRLIIIRPYNVQIQRQRNFPQFACDQSYLQLLGLTLIDNSILWYDRVLGQHLGLLGLRNNVELSLEVGIVLYLDYPRLWVIQASFGKFYLLGWADLHVWDLTVGLYWHAQHIVAHSFNVDRHHRLVLLY